MLPSLQYRSVVLVLLFSGAGVKATPAWAQGSGGRSSPASRSYPAAADEALAAGVTALRGNDPPAAAAAFSTLTSLRPQFAEGFLNLGLALEQEKKYPDAIRTLERARTLKPSLRGTNLFLGIAEYQSGALPRAETDLLQEIKLNPKDASAHMWLGITEEALGKIAEAASALDAASALAPKDPDILFHRGRAHLLLSKSSYEQMFALEPDSYRVHEVLAQADAEADRTADAIAEYKLAAERAPDHQGIHEELGDLYWTSGSMDAADEAYTRELAIDPYSFTSNYKLGSLRVIVGKPRDATALLENAIKLEPTFESSYYYLGRAQVDLGENEAGFANLKRASLAVGDTTLNTLAFYQLSRLYRRLHRTEEANAALSQFRTLRDAADKRQADKRALAIDKHRQLPRPETIPTEEEVRAP